MSESVITVCDASLEDRSLYVALFRGDLYAFEALRVDRLLHDPSLLCFVDEGGECQPAPLLSDLSHMRAVAIAPLIIRWGPDGWQDMLRRAARCTHCGKRGVELQHPSWGGSGTGRASMPISQMALLPDL